MDQRELGLYLEEQRVELINLNKGIAQLSQLVQKQIDDYQPPVSDVKVEGSVQVNTEKSVEVTNLQELQKWLGTLGQNVREAIETNKPEAVTEITVKNIQDAKQPDIKVTNFKELAKFFEQLNENITNLPQPYVNVEKQDIVFPTAANKPISVRLSDGKSFYNAITAYADANRVDTDGIISAINGISISGGGSTAQVDVFNQMIAGTRNNQIEIDYSGTDPDSISLLTVTKTNGGDAATSGGQAVYSTGTNTSGEIKSITTRTVTYHPHAENYVAFTAIFTTGVSSSFQRIGLYDDNNGFFIGYEGTSFGVTKRSGGVDVTTAQASFSEDTLTGQSGTGYTRDGVIEAADFNKDNLFRIRYGWLGAAPIYYEILSPDGAWVTFHIIRHPNTAAVPTIEEPNQPIRLHIKKTTAGATNLIMRTACWAAGTTSDLQKITTTLYDETLAKTVRSVITGVTTGGGGGYVNVKVNPSGALTVDSTISGSVTSYAKPSEQYAISNKEATAIYKYFGFQRLDGYWYIMRKTIATNVFEYVAGTSAYSTAWTNRASQTYTDYATAF